MPVVVTFPPRIEVPVIERFETFETDPAVIAFPIISRSNPPPSVEFVMLTFVAVNVRSPPVLKTAPQ